MRNEKELKRRRRRLLLGVAACVLMMVSDLLWKATGASPVSTKLGSFADAAWMDVAMWRLVLSNLLTAAAVPLYFIGFSEMVRLVRERAVSKLERRAAMLFRIGVIAGAIAFLFIHTLCVSMPMILQLTAEQLDTVQAAAIVNRYMSLNLAPMVLYYLATDVVLSAAMIVLVWKKTLPVSRLWLVCNPLCASVIGTVLAMLPWPLSLIDTVSEPCGHLLIAVIGLIVVKKDSRRMPRRKHREEDLPPILNLDDEPDSDFTII